MSLVFAHGDFAWNAADAATTTYVVAPGFLAKAIVVWITGLSSATDTTSNTTDGRVSIGFATNASDRRCQGFLDVDAAGTMDTQEIYRDDAVVATVDAAGAVDGRLDISAIDSTTITFIVDDPAPVNLRVFWAAWGGGDITNAATGEITEPAATGNQSYTVTGSFQPTVGLFAGCQLTTAPPTAGVADAGLMFGAATGTGTGNQWVEAINSDEASANVDSDKYSRGDECMAMIVSGGGNPDARAAFNGFDSVGFDLDWTARAVTNRRYIYLVIAGGQWKAGSYNINVGTVGNTATVSGLAFRPDGGLSLGRSQTPEDAAGSSSTFNQMTIGCWSAVNSRRNQGYMDANSSPSADVGLTIDYDSILAVPSPATGTLFVVDLDLVNSDGFRVIIDSTNIAGATSFQSYLVFASIPRIQPNEGHFPDLLSRFSGIVSSGARPGRI